MNCVKRGIQEWSEVEGHAEPRVKENKGKKARKRGGWMQTLLGCWSNWCVGSLTSTCLCLTGNGRGQGLSWILTLLSFCDFLLLNLQWLQYSQSSKICSNIVCIYSSLIIIYICSCPRCQYMIMEVCSSFVSHNFSRCMAHIRTVLEKLLKK